MFKGVSFFSLNDEYVMTGSDCSRIFIWRKMDAKLACAKAAHDDIISKKYPHPQMPFLCELRPGTRCKGMVTVGNQCSSTAGQYPGGKSKAQHGHYSPVLGRKN
ncbi:hypothetical protein MLD38_003533 [Melastoma candidum]|uniref:Uncharacterized protein n=1 Tax=Melastoma candidum TaxID=119954 RepID=A0ACB9S487_9MYRT|nr:hypothetical protein MLD38_003533 [Melastoma candidum]